MDVEELVAVPVFHMIGYPICFDPGHALADVLPNDVLDDNLQLP